MIGTGHSSEGVERQVKIGAELYVIIGVLIGNLCHTPTALMLITFWIIVRNPKLPEIVGGKCPQELIVDISVMLYGLAMTVLFKRNRVKREVDIVSKVETASRIVSAPIANQSVAMSSGVDTSIPRPTSKISNLSFSFVAPSQ